MPGALHSPAHSIYEARQQQPSPRLSTGNRIPVSGYRGGRRLSTARKYERLTFTSAQEISAIQKISENFFGNPSIEDIKLLFDVLDKENDGCVAWHLLAYFFLEVCDPPFTEFEMEAIFKLTDQRRDGLVAPEEIQRAFQNPAIKLQLMHLHQNFKVKKEYTISQGIAAEVKRDLLVDRLHRQVARDDAFATLPFSSVFLVVFLLLVVFHLQIWNRQQVERGLEAWIEGYGKDLPGPYLKQAVNGPASLWSWLLSSGVLAVVGDCEVSPGSAGQCRLATRNVLIGDAQLRQDRADGSEKAAWLLNSDAARAHLASQPQDYLGAATSSLRHLQGSGWMDEGTESLQLVFSTYNEHAKMFATTEVIVGFDAYGYVEPVVVAAAAIADPYPFWAIFVLDAFYVLSVLYPLQQEMKDIASWIRMAGFCKGLRGYTTGLIGFWNAVDWMNIFVGIVQACAWVMCFLAVEADSIQHLLHGDGLGLTPHAVDIGTDALEAIRSELANVIRSFFWLHIIMAANVFVVMMKFFKAFQANPKLQLVTSTLGNAGPDIFHFCVVAGAVFTGYAVIGHILFGGDIVAFNTLERSMNTAFIVLMGDFEWYIQASESEVGLASGVPWFLVVMWFWSFMVFNFLILMNMLMAIILEHYADCFRKVKSDPDACALWVQAWRYMQQLRNTKDFVPFSQLLFQLVDETNRVHPGTKVSTASLMKAFQMPPEQAVVLMDGLRKEAMKRMADAAGGQDQQLARLIQVEGFLEGMAEILRIISLNVSQCSKLVQDSQMAGAARHAVDQDPVQRGSEMSGLGAEFLQQLKTQGATVEDLNHVASMLRDAVAHLGAYDSSPKSSVVDQLGTLPASARDTSSIPRESQRPAVSCCDVHRSTRGQAGLL